MSKRKVQLLLLIANILVWSHVGCRVWGADGFGGVPWPRHIEWTEYDVPNAGWTICRPVTPADSLAAQEVCIPLPEGTEIYVPRWVPGPDPGARRSPQG